MREIKLETGEIYHVTSRSIAETHIFTHEKDCSYFLEGLRLSNTTAKLPLHWRHLLLKKGIDLQNIIPKGEPLVRFYALSLMPTHFHFAVEQLVDGGIERLMQRNLNSYGKFFNTKYGRKGRFFASPYQAVHVDNDVQAQHLLTYIHANPLDLVAHEWRKGAVSRWEKAEKHLLRYRWSSLPVFAELPVAHPTVSAMIDKSFGAMYHKHSSEYVETIRQWGSREFAIIQDVVCERPSLATLSVAREKRLKYPYFSAFLSLQHLVLQTGVVNESGVD